MSNQCWPSRNRYPGDTSGYLSAQLLEQRGSVEILHHPYLQLGMCSTNSPARMVGSRRREGQVDTEVVTVQPTAEKVATPPFSSTSIATYYHCLATKLLQKVSQ
jgi:hypothetical protein